MKLGMDENFLNCLIYRVYSFLKKNAVNIICNHKIENSSPETGNKTKMFVISTSIQYCIVHPGQHQKHKEKKKKYTDWKRKNKTENNHRQQIVGSFEFSIYTEKN